MNFNFYQQQSRIHDQFHLIYPTAAAVQHYHIDLSCQICYPARPVNLQFQNFWNWFSVEYPAGFYNRITQNLLNNIVQPAQANPQLFLDLVSSIRYYADPGNIQDLVRNIATAVIQTNLFQNDPFETLYYISEYTGSTASTIETEDLTVTTEEDTQSHNSESTISDNNMNRNLNVQPLARDFQDVANELYQLTQALPQLRQVLTNNTQAVNNPPR